MRSCALVLTLLGAPTCALGKKQPSTFWSISMVQADQVEEAETAPVKVCIIDTGLYTGLPEFAAQTERIRGTDARPAGDWDGPADKHGTFVAGTIFAMQNEKSFDGRRVSVNAAGRLRVHFIGTAVSDVHGCPDGENGDSWCVDSSRDVVRAIDRCVEVGARVVSMSFGDQLKDDGTADAWSDGWPDDVQEKLRQHRENGVLMIAAAGNGFYGFGRYVGFPAADPSVMSVAAVDKHMAVAAFSQRNEFVEIAAPGDEILSSAENSDEQLDSGTSYATPHVSGVAALVWNHLPSCTADEVREALTATAIDLGETGRDEEYGYGLVQARAALEYLEAPGRCLKPTCWASEDEGRVVWVDPGEELSVTFFMMDKGQAGTPLWWTPRYVCSGGGQVEFSVAEGEALKVEKGVGRGSTTATLRTGLGDVGNTFDLRVAFGVPEAEEVTCSVRVKVRKYLRLRTLDTNEHSAPPELNMGSFADARDEEVWRFRTDVLGDVVLSVTPAQTVIATLMDASGRSVQFNWDEGDLRDTVRAEGVPAGEYRVLLRPRVSSIDRDRDWEHPWAEVQWPLPFTVSVELAEAAGFEVDPAYGPPEGAALLQGFEYLTPPGAGGGSVLNVAEVGGQDATVFVFKVKETAPATPAPTGPAFDECGGTWREKGPLRTCMQEEQDCVDPDHLVRGDWECHCAGPWRYGLIPWRVGAPVKDCWPWPRPRPEIRPVSDAAVNTALVIPETDGVKKGMVDVEVRVLEWAVPEGGLFAHAERRNHRGMVLPILPDLPDGGRGVAPDGGRGVGPQDNRNAYALDAPLPAGVYMLTVRVNARRRAEDRCGNRRISVRSVGTPTLAPVEVGDVFRYVPKATAGDDFSSGELSCRWAADGRHVDVIKEDSVVGGFLRVGKRSAMTFAAADAPAGCPKRRRARTLGAGGLSVVEVRYAARVGHLADGEALVVECRVDGGAWVELHAVAQGADFAAHSHRHHHYNAPAAGGVVDVEVRFSLRAGGDAAYADVDDVAVAVASLPPPPGAAEPSPAPTTAVPTSSPPTPAPATPSPPTPGAWWAQWSSGTCRGGQAPWWARWLRTFATEEECCSSNFQWRYHACLGIQKKGWWPSWRRQRCVDGGAPEWQRTTETQEECCHKYFFWNATACGAAP
eukprot:TRINITY_DN329_c1_g1_i2.p1 TRINITY_DN329_c1_g1~~TRINITY_DN329_c1_g1_i2.p1  ORF type:complete len:1145 (+),score=271.98 TRINITY_DN329_c1_g1_i2:37-3471(+)